jgi:hypothetical protein
MHFVVWSMVAIARCAPHEDQRQRCGEVWDLLVEHFGKGQRKGGIPIHTLAFEEVPIDFILDFRDNIRLAIEAKKAFVELRSCG